MTFETEVFEDIKGLILQTGLSEWKKEDIEEYILDNGTKSLRYPHVWKKHWTLWCNVCTRNKWMYADPHDAKFKLNMATPKIKTLLAEALELRDFKDDRE